MMEILRAAKNNQPVSSSLAALLISSLQIQIICLFLINKSTSIYGKIFEFISTESPVSILVVVFFCLHLLEGLYIISWIFIFRNKNKSKSKNTASKSDILRFIQIKNYIIFVQLVNFNSLALKESQNSIQILAAFNLLFAVFELSTLRIINTSYRFFEKNHIRRKNSSIFAWIIILPIIFTINFFSNIYSSFFMFVRALVQLYNNFNNVQSQVVRQLEWFYPLLSIIAAIVVIIDEQFQFQFFNNNIFIAFVVSFSIYCSSNLSQNLTLQILKWHINKSEYIMQSQNKGQVSENQPTASIDQKELQEIVLQLRIIIKVYGSRLRTKCMSHDQIQHSDNFDNWWNLFDRFILDHKMYCQNVNCLCSQLVFRSSQNQEIQNKIFIEKAYALIKRLQVQGASSGKKLRIIQNYFLIQIQKRPLKTYYQLVKLFVSPLSKQQTLEVQNLIFQTRNIFKEFFIKEKVQNIDLQVEPVFDYQNRMKEMRTRMNEMALQYKKFYDIFASNFVQMDALKNKTRLLTRFKKKFTEELDYCLMNFNKSIELMTFCMVYYRFFDEYTNKLERIESKIVSLYESFFNPYNEYKKQHVEIFNPNYGAVKVDLVFNPGKIVHISKNLCQTLGFAHRDIEGLKVNKLMPHMFARVHDKFLSNFIDRGSVKMLKYKQKVYYARNAGKFLTPVSMRLKVDHSSFDSLCAVSFLRPTQTKSDFIILNNYGKIEEISCEIYKKLFQNVFHDELWKVKKLCLGKMLLSLNYFIKDAKQNDTSVHEGLLLTSDDEKTLMDYYKFPELSISFKKNDGAESVRSVKSAKSIEHSLSSQSRSLDFSDDMGKFSLDMKQSLKDYLKKLDTSKVIGYRISYRLEDYVTNEFKCKVLEIINIRDEMIKSDLKNALSIEITQISEFFGLEQDQYMKFRSMKTQHFATYKQESDFNLKKTINLQQEHDDESENQELKKKVKFLPHDGGRGQSDTSSVISLNEAQKKKESIIAAFEQRIIISENLQYGLTFLILAMALILIIISVFSIGLKSNYVDLQHDNLIITNFRINFLLRVGIQELQRLYNSFRITPPSFLQQKKVVVEEKMKEHLIKSPKWIDISGNDYAQKLTMEYTDQNYSEQRSILYVLGNIYTSFIVDQSLGRYITDNYVAIANNLLLVTSKEEVLIMNKSLFYKMQIHIVVAFYSVVMISLIIVGVWFRKISFQKQNKIIDFLPFLKTQSAKKKVRFFQLFFQFNKESENIDVQLIGKIAQTSQKYDSMNQKKLNRFSHNQVKKTKPQNSQGYDTNSKLIRVVKNQKNGINSKIMMVALVVFTLCVFVIFFSEYFFAQIHSKFEAYLKLKNSAFLVQLIPARIVALYFMNINKAIHFEKTISLPESYTTLVHDRIFELQTGLSSSDLYGIEMQKIIRDHFSKDICSLVPCRKDAEASTQVHDQQLFYLAYRYINAFDYMRRIIKILPNYKDPETEVRKWMEENNMLEIMKSTEFILDLMKKNEEEITDLFTDQIMHIGQILLALSLTLIPILIVVLLMTRSKYIEYVSDRLECTQNVYKHISWDMLSQNSYAITYFEDKLKNSKKY